MRKKRAEKRPTMPDPRYNDVFVSQFINSVMKQGRKHTARRIMYDALALVEERTKNPGLDVFRKAMSNVRPVLEVRARRVGGATYQVPTEVRSDRSVALAIRWLINYASDRKDKSMAQKLAAEFIAASNGEGSAIKKKEDVHKMAEANKAFAHFKW
ncbi:MAG: 30S ribosomal protein S7 [Bacteroidetes bacterium]|nr:30S ribosomal protein S7 [Bacteroidota bacterium]MCW5896409.1 30S ribosomal protein S7 [Bacteroidota bacterium]